MITIGSGLGGFTAIAVQPTYGAAFATPTRVLPTFKSNKATWDPHPVQGGPYLSGGRIVDIGSAHELIYRDAKGTITGDMGNTGAALLLAIALGSVGILEKSGTTTAYELGGAGGIALGAPDANNEKESGCCFDMQLGVPTADGTVHPVNLHSCMITKAEWVFDRTGLVTYSYDYDAQFVEQETGLIVPSFTTAVVPFSMSVGSSAFKAGAFGSEAAVDGIRKVTVTIDRKLDTNRIYLGGEKKGIPITNGLVDVSMAIESDYTVAAKALWEKWLTNEPESILCEAVGGTIGSSGKKDTLLVNVANGYIETGGERNLDGPDIVKNTLMYKGKIDAANDPAVKAKLITADSGW